MLSVLRKESAHLEVAYDSFITASGSSASPRKVGFGLLVVLIAVTAELEMKPPFPIGAHFPGLLIHLESVKSEDVVRAWSVWLQLVTETKIMLDYLHGNLGKALECAKTPQLVESMIAALGQSPDIRPIDLRKLSKVTSANRAVLCEAADNFHRTIQRVRDIVYESITVLYSLYNSLDLQRKLQAVSLKARQSGLIDPESIVRELGGDVRELLTLCN